MAKKDLAKTILRTLIYADIFDYPLKREEIGKWLIGSKIINYKLQIINQLQNSKLIKKKNGYYFLKERENIINIRLQRESYAKEKLKLAKKITSILKIIPTIQLIGITGALAMNNTKKDDDIDLFIITSANFLWTTRFFTTMIVEFTGLRRHRGEYIANDKICLNMFVDDEHLEVPKKEQDLFAAHEVLQMKPIFQRKSIYPKFLTANKWVNKYLPNAYNEMILTTKPKDTSGVARWTPPRWRNQMGIIENLLKNFQLWYMRNHRTSEVIKDGIIRFHPHDARKWVLEEYHKKLSLYGL